MVKITNPDTVFARSEITGNSQITPELQERDTNKLTQVDEKLKNIKQLIKENEIIILLASFLIIKNKLLLGIIAVLLYFNNPSIINDVKAKLEGIV